VDYTSWTVPALKAEYAKQAAIHEAAAVERKAVAEELERRKREAGLRMKLNQLSADDIATLKEVLSEYPKA